MAERQTEDQKVIIHKASKILQTKAGTGEVSRAVIDKAEKVIRDNDVDFVPMAQTYLDALATAVQTADTMNLEDLRHAVTKPVMELKATAKLFGFELVGDLATIMLGFLEEVKQVDKDVIAIVDAHHKTLSAVIKSNMKGNGGPHGAAMRTELTAACNRYMKKGQS